MNRDKELTLIQLVFTAGFGLAIFGMQFLTQEAPSQTDKNTAIFFFVLGFIAALIALYKFKKIK